MITGYHGHVLICPFDERLVDSIKNAELIIDINDPADIAAARNLANRNQNKLHVIRLNVKGDLADMEISPAWRDIPLAITLSGGLGRFRTLHGKLSALRSLDARFYRSLDHPGIYSETRILSSLGIATVLTLGEREPDWEALADLMVYALLGLAPHAPIGPFDYYRDHFKAASHTNIARVYFDDPERTLHLDREGRVALTSDDLAAGRFVLDELSEIGGLAARPDYQQRVNEWREVFLDFGGCGACPVWSVCMGHCHSIAGDQSGCRVFFKELADVLHQERAKKMEAVQRWRY